MKVCNSSKVLTATGSLFLAVSLHYPTFPTQSHKTNSDPECTQSWKRADSGGSKSCYPSGSILRRWRRFPNYCKATWDSKYSAGPVASGTCSSWSCSVALRRLWLRNWSWIWSRQGLPHSAFRRALSDCPPTCSHSVRSPASSLALSWYSDSTISFCMCFHGSCSHPACRLFFTGSYAFEKYFGWKVCEMAFHRWEAPG